MKQMNEAPHNVKPSSSILVGLCTAHRYEERRKAQRETWLTQPEEGIQTLFFLGEGESEDGDLGCDDMLILPVEDDYDHLPMKVFAFYEYALEHYDFDWIFKCDDDTYIALDRLASVADKNYEMIGDMSFAERGAPSGGAGYFLSRSLVEKIVKRGNIPETGYEDIIFGEIAHELNARWFGTPRLCMYNTHYPQKHNDLVTAHWCTPAQIRAIHLLYSEWPEIAVEATHEHWQRDYLYFYKNGVFRREKTDCYGYWCFDEKHTLELNWCFWDADILRWSPSGYQHELLNVPLTDDAIEALYEWQKAMHEEALGLKGVKDRFIHIGSGGNHLTDWVNTDYPQIDITKPLPFRNDSVDAFFIEHVIEHVTTADAYYFFEEAWRSLKKGGVLRLAFPDIIRIEKMSNNAYLDFIQSNGWGNGEKGSDIRSIVVNNGHLAIWTIETMRIVLESLGFQVSVCEVGESKHRHLRHLEHHGSHISDEINSIETSCIEAQKP